MSELKVPGGNVLLTGRNYVMKHRKQWNKSEGDLAFYRDFHGTAVELTVYSIGELSFPKKTCNGMLEVCPTGEIILSFGGRSAMSKESRRVAGLLLIILPTVLYGGVSLLRLLTDPGSGYAENPLRQDLFRAGHAHAGVLLVLSLITLRYVDETSLSDGWKQFVRSSIPTSAIFLPAAFFFSVLSPDAAKPNAFIYLAYVGAVLLGAGLVTLGIGLLKGKNDA